MKTVLIPTDFNLESTKVLDALLRDKPDERINAVFLHAFKLSDSISDMLLLSRRSRDYQIVSDEFYEKLEAYRQRHKPRLASIGIEYFYGSTTAAFKNFMEALSADCIAFPLNYKFRPINKYSLDLKGLTERVSCEIFIADTSNIFETEQLMDTRIPEGHLAQTYV